MVDDWYWFLVDLSNNLRSPKVLSDARKIMQVMQSFRVQVSLCLVVLFLESFVQHQYRSKCTIKTQQWTWSVDFSSQSHKPFENSILRTRMKVCLYADFFQAFESYDWTVLTTCEQNNEIIYFQQKSLVTFSGKSLQIHVMTVSSWMGFVLRSATHHSANKLFLKTE